MVTPFRRAHGSRVKTINLHSLLLTTALILSTHSLFGQGLYAFRFDGLRYETNSAGVFQRHRVTQQTILEEIARRANLPTTEGMMLAYHVNGNELGDTIDVIDSRTGRVLDTYIGLYFGQSFARIGVTNSAGTEVKRIDYVYTKQDSHSMGAALVTIRRLGTSPVSPVFVNGTMDYCWAAREGEQSRIYTGTFRTGRRLRF